MKQMEMCMNAKTKKIFRLITLSELGGARIVMANLANKLAKKHDVTVLAGEGDGQMFALLDSKIRKIHIPLLKRAISPVSDLLAKKQ
jgi:phosphoheptose isomerase